jgi:hypothetical protein
MRRLLALVASFVSCAPVSSPSARAPATPEPVPAATPATPGTGAAEVSCVHDAAAEAEVTVALEREVRRWELPSDYRVVTTFECPRLSSPRFMVGLRSHGHGGGLTVLDASVEADDRVELRAVSLIPSPQAVTLEGPATGVALARATLAGERARRELAIARAALAARIALVAPPPPRAAGSLSGTSSSTLSSDDEEVELRTRGMRGQELARQWQGTCGSDEIAEQAPVELAFSTLAGLLPAAKPAPVEDGDREVVADAWQAPFAHQAWVNERLLELASVVGSRPLATGVLQALSSGDERQQIRAVRAAAAITGRDVIHDGHGHLRPLAEIVVDYRGQLAGMK